MAKATHIKISGNWKTVINIWRKVSGVWQSGVISYIHAGGVWKQCIEYAPATPTGLTLSQPSFGDHIHANWNTVTGATGYQLQRKPWWDGGTWQNSWKQVYDGGSTSADDDIQMDASPSVPSISDGDPFDYQVRAYNGGGYSAWSATEQILWTNM